MKRVQKKKTRRNVYKKQDFNFNSIHMYRLGSIRFFSTNCTLYRLIQVYIKNNFKMNRIHRICIYIQIYSKRKYDPIYKYIKLMRTNLCLVLNTNKPFV